MNQMQYTPYTLPLAAIAVLLAVLSAQIWRRRNAAGAISALAAMLAMTVYAGGYAMELSSTTLADISWWVTVEYLGIVAIPVTVLGFALGYSGRGYLLTHRNILLLSVEPAIILALQVTNSVHHLMQAVVVLDNSGPFVVQRVVAYGPAFWVHTLYAYVLTCVALFVLGQMLIRSFRTYRLQASVLLLGLLAPWVADVISVMGWTSLPRVDLTPFGFGVTGIAVAWSLFGLQLLDIIPVARTAVIMGMADAVLVLDSRNRVVFLNPAAQTLLGWRAADTRGHALEDVCQGWPALLQRLQSGAETGEPLEMAQAAELRRYDARISQMRDWRGRLTSRVVVLRDITASSAAEELQRRSREYLRALVENALDLIVVIGPDERVVYAGPSLEHILAYQVDQVLGKRVLDYIHPDDADTVAGVLSRALQNPELVQRAELRARHANSEWRTLQATGRALIDEGQVVGVVANARDVTQERADEEEQRRRAEELAALQQTLLDISASKDLHALLTRIVERSAHLLHAPTAGLYLCEPGREELRLVVSHNTPRHYDGFVLKFGEGASGVVAQTARPLIVQDYRVWEGRAAAYEQDQPFTSVLCVPLLWHGRVTGTIAVSNRPSTEPFTKQDQELLSLFASNTAIAIENARLYDAAQAELAERRRAEAALGESEERYRSLVENMPIGVFRTTPGAEGRYLMANRAFLSMFGYDSFEQLSAVTPASLYVNPQERALVSEQVIAQGQVIGVELELKRKDGTRLWGRATLRTAYDESGRITHFDCVLEDITERKLAGEELQRLKEFNEGIVLGVAEALVIEDEHGLLTFLNPAAERLLGYGPGELLGHPWQKIVPPDQIALIEGKVAQRPEGRSEQYETRLLCKDGREIPVLISARPMFRDGAFAGVLSACTDISEPKRAEQALRESEARYRALFAEAERHATELKLLGEVRSVLASELDPAVICRKVVEVIAKTFGYTQVSLYLLQGDTLWLQHQVGYDHVIESIPITAGISGRVVRTGQAVLLKDVHSDPAFLGAIEGVASEVCVPLREGERLIGVLNIETRNGVELMDADLRLMEAVSQHMNVAMSRARLYAQALEDEARYRRIFEDSPISLWEEDFSDVRQCLQELKASGVTDFRAYFDANPDAFRKAFDRVKVVDVNRMTVTLYKASSKEELLTGLKRIVHPDGYEAIKEHFVRLAQGQLSWRGEVVNQTLTGDKVYTDITWQVFPGYEQTWARAITSAIDITEHKLAEQQREKLELQLRQAQKMEAVGMLAGGVAHDFNNLLTVIQGNAELGLSLPQDADRSQQGFLAIQKTAKRGAALTQQLLAFSRRQVLNPQVLDLNEVVRGFAAIYGRVIAAQVELKLDLASKAGTVLADSGALEQVLINLALNARDAMPQGGTLHIATADLNCDEAFVGSHHGVQVGPHVRLSVSDTGVGMDEERRKHLFEPFFTTKDVGKGTGLGLSVVYGIISQHSGWIEVDSQPGRGTRFDIYLPTRRAAPTAPVAAPGRETRGGSETILVAEDEAPVLEVTRTVLESLGYRVLEAVDGEEAVRLFESQPGGVDMLLLDAVMPRLSGPLAYDQIKALRPDVPVLFITGYSADMANVPLLKTLGRPVLHKPFDIATLASRVRELLDQSQQRVGGASTPARGRDGVESQHHPSKEER